MERAMVPTNTRFLLNHMLSQAQRLTSSSKKFPKKKKQILFTIKTNLIAQYIIHMYAYKLHPKIYYNFPYFLPASCAI